jgi:hypothetical protein
MYRTGTGQQVLGDLYVSTSADPPKEGLLDAGQEHDTRRVGDMNGSPEMIILFVMNQEPETDGKEAK